MNPTFILYYFLLLFAAACNYEVLGIHCNMHFVVYYLSFYEGPDKLLFKLISLANYKIPFP
jgi:hypothetical protein